MDYNKKYITTTLPYINSVPHIGHAFEFCIADLIADFSKFAYGKENVIFNVGVDEHGQKIAQKAHEEGYKEYQGIKDYCDKLAQKWKYFCQEFKIDYTNFYRTTDPKHELQAARFFDELRILTDSIYRKTYTGQYCIGCEAFKTEKEIVHDKCAIHNTKLTWISEENAFFKLSDYGDQIKDILVDSNLSKELENLLKEKFDLSITRQNVDWGISTHNEDQPNETLYVWFEALLNYIFSIGYYDDNKKFSEYWENSLQICGKDNLKFQAFIFQALLLARGIPQTKELLVHGTILDENGIKMSKTQGNVIDPLEQKAKFGLSPLRYYLTFGLQVTGDSRYSEVDLTEIWNSEIVNGFGNLVSRVLHLIDIKGINPDFSEIRYDSEGPIRGLNTFNSVVENICVNYDFQEARKVLNDEIALLNKKLQDTKPWEKACENPEKILLEVYHELKSLSHAYRIILKEHQDAIREAFLFNKKVILFNRI